MKRAASARSETNASPTRAASLQATKRTRYGQEETPERESGAFAALPNELLAQIAAAAGPLGASRAAAASTRFGPYAREVMQQVTQQVQTTLCPDYWSCLRALECAMAADDADRVERILAAGIVNAFLPVAPLDAVVGTDRDTATPWALAQGPCLLPLDIGPLSFLSASSPVPEGWTPLALAAVMGSRRTVRLLVSIGARPRLTTESLVNGLIQYVSNVDTRAQGLRRYALSAPPAATLPDVLLSFPRTHPLAAADANPLSVFRTMVLSAAGDFMWPLVYALRTGVQSAGQEERVAREIGGVLGPIMLALPWRHAFDRDLRGDLQSGEINSAVDAQTGALVTAFINSDVAPLDTLERLLDAGYDPLERVTIMPTQRLRGLGSEIDAALAASARALDQVDTCEASSFPLRCFGDRLYYGTMATINRLFFDRYMELLIDGVLAHAAQESTGMAEGEA